MKKFVAIILTILLTIQSITVFGSELPMKQVYNNNEYLVINECPIYDGAFNIIGYCDSGTYIKSVWDNGLYVFVSKGNTMGFVPKCSVIQGDKIFEYLAFQNRNIVDYIFVSNNDIYKVSKFDYSYIYGKSITTNKKATFISYRNEVKPVFLSPIFY